jgi:hypothetical protein
MHVYRRARYISILAVIVASAPVACGSGDNGVSPLPPGYVGEWIGTTSHGTTFRFSASDADTVTSITLTYNASAGCSGTLTYTNLALPIHRLEPPGPPPFDQPGFGFSENTVLTGTLIAGYFSPDRRSAAGEFRLVKYSGCDIVVGGTWTATRP